jgi:hypothetical protein
LAAAGLLGGDFAAGLAADLGAGLAGAAEGFLAAAFLGVGLLAMALVSFFA